MKIDLKDKLNIKDKLQGSRDLRLKRETPAVTESAGFSVESFSEADGFGAMVHSSSPILRQKEGRKRIVWTKDLLLNCTSALLVTSAIAIFCMCIDSPLLIVFSLACFVTYMAVATVGTVKPGTVKWITAAVIFVVLAAVAAVFHEAILGGLSMLMNMFYDVAEEAQAYIYKRPHVAEVSDEASYAAMAWVSSLIGLITALPPVEARRSVSGLIVIVVMLMLAYYGLLPSAICIGVLIAMLIAAVSRGSVLSFIPVVLVALLFFGAVMLVDPGESYGISRMDENFRDRFALRSVLLDTQNSLTEEEQQNNEEDAEDLDNEDAEDMEHEKNMHALAGLGIFILILGAAGAVAYLQYRRVSRKAEENRRGIGSNDAREAVTAMFPYAVRWLKGYGVEQPSASVTSMMPALKTEFSDDYAWRFKDMYVIWSEAAYSDHEVSEETRLMMNKFMEDTIVLIKDKCSFMDKLKLRYRYAL